MNALDSSTGASFSRGGAYGSVDDSALCEVRCWIAIAPLSSSAID
jgi:hypothetical protein